MSKRPNLLYKIFMSQWMLDPQTAHAASLVLADMIGAARLKAKYGVMEYDDGAADSVRLLADAITNCKKPVLAYCDGYMCSAAYYAASYCGHIMANDPRSMVGCIGTMIQFADYPAKAKDEDGYMRLRIYADPSDEKNADYEAALEGNFKPIRENLLNPLAEDFRRDVKTNRPKATDDQLRGRTYFAQDVQGTLIDTIGDFPSAVDKALKMTNLNITTMKGHENLQSLDTCRDLQMVDGYVSLNGEQLAEIDTAISEGKTAKALNETDAKTISEQATTITNLTTERDDLKAKADQLPAKEQKITDLTTERDTLKEQNAQKDARIAELEAALENNPENEEDPLPAMHNGNPAKPEDDWKEPSDEESAAYCRQVLNGEI